MQFKKAMEQGKTTGETKTGTTEGKLEDKGAEAPKTNNVEANTAEENKEQPDGGNGENGENGENNVDNMMKALEDMQKGGVQKEPEEKPVELKLDQVLELGFKWFSIIFSLGYVNTLFNSLIDYRSGSHLGTKRQ